NTQTTDLKSIGSVTAVGNTVFFTASDESHGTELWKSTSTGVTLVRDINPETPSSVPQDLTNVNGTLYFTAVDRTLGVDVWKSDGTAAGTVRLRPPGPDLFLGPQNLTNMNGVLYFTATDAINGEELWKTDGTPEGTVLVKDIFPNSNSSSPSNLTDV